jgi:hypothetical protein
MNFISFHSYLFDFMSILWFGLLFNTVINPNCHKDKILLWVVMEVDPEPALFD